MFNDICCIKTQIRLVYNGNICLIKMKKFHLETNKKIYICKQKLITINCSTNLPKEVMDFPDFKFPTNMRESYILASDVLAYFQAYAEHFQLLPHIQLQQEVVRVRPQHNKWEVSVCVRFANKRKLLSAFLHIFKNLFKFSRF